MGIRDAKKYIGELHKKQSNPYMWPDFLTGLPDKVAIITKLDEVYPKIGEYSVSLVRIANVQPYLNKYGPSKHIEIIEWAAAILKSTADKYNGLFIGAFSTHDFIAMGKSSDIKKFFKEASDLFDKKVLEFYTEKDRQNRLVFSFMRDGVRIDVGLMKLLNVSIEDKKDCQKTQILQNLVNLCAVCEIPS